LDHPVVYFIKRLHCVNHVSCGEHFPNVLGTSLNRFPVRSAVQYTVTCGSPSVCLVCALNIDNVNEKNIILQDIRVCFALSPSCWL